MIPGTIFAGGPWAGLSALTPSPVVVTGDADAAHLIEIELPGYAAPFSAASGPFCGGPWGGLQRLGNGSSDAIFRASDAWWIGRPTDPDRPNVEYPGIAINPLSLERSVPIDPAADAAELRLGTISLIAAGGIIDDIVRRNSIGKRWVTVRRGPRQGDFRNFATIARVLATGWSVNRDEAQVELQGISYRLDEPVQSATYGGTGGADGTEDLKGTRKPLGRGLCRNVPPQIVSRPLNIGQFNTGSSDAVLGAYDRVEQLEFCGADYPTYAALAAATTGIYGSGADIEDGEYATCLAKSLIRTAATPSLLTVDFQAGGLATHAELAVWVLGLLGITLSEIDVPSFVVWPTGTAGIWFAPGEDVTGQVALSDIARSCCGRVGETPDGKFTAYRLANPALRYPEATLTEVDALDVQPLGAPFAPRWRHTVGYRPNYRVQAGGDASETADADRLKYVAKEYETTEAADASIKIRYADAVDSPVHPSLFDNAADAETLADYLLSTYRAPWQPYTVTTRRAAETDWMRAAVRVVWPRYGFSAGRVGAVIGQKNDYGNDDHSLVVLVRHE